MGRSENVRDWKRALGILTPYQRRIEGGKPLDSAADIVEHLQICTGAFPAQLKEALTAAEGDPDAIAKVIAEAPSYPASWLTKGFFGW